MNTEIFILKENEYPVFENLYQGDLKRTGEKACVFGAVSEEEPSALAVMEYDPAEKICWLTWLYVRADLRRNGIGTELLFAMTRILGKSVFANTFAAVCANEEQKSFFEAAGFSIREPEHHFRYVATLSDLKEVGTGKKAETGQQLSALSEQELYSLEQELAADPNAIPTRLIPGTFLPESRVLRTEEGLQALLLLQADEDAIVISNAYAKKGQGVSLMALISEAAEEFRIRLNPSYPIRVTVVNEKAEKLVEKLLPDAEKKPVAVAEYDLVLA